MNRALFPLALCLLVLTPAWSQTSLESVATAVRGQALSLPAQTPLVSLTPNDKSNPRQTYTVQRTFAPDGTFTVEWKSATYQSLQSFRPDGTLISGKQSDLKKAISVEATTDAARKTIRTVITQDGKVKSDKKADLKPGIALREELQHLVLQAWQQGIRGTLKLQSLSPDGGMAGDFQIVFVSVADPTTLSTKYDYPVEFRTALRASNQYVVADMSLQGIGAFFFPHHFYLVYKPTASGLEFVSYFGEDPKAAVFQFLGK